MQNPQEYHLLAKSLATQGKYEEAEEAANKAIALDKKCYKAYMDLGDIYTFTGNYIKAQKNYLTALEYAGDDNGNREVIYYNLGSIYNREKDAVKSWDYFSRAYAIKSYLADAKFWEASPIPELKFVAKHDKHSFLQQIKTNKVFPQELLKKIRGVRKDMRRGQYQKVIEECKRYIADNPGSVYAYLFGEMMLYSLVKMKNYDAAAQNLNLFNNLKLDKIHEQWFSYIRTVIAYHQKRYKEVWTNLEGVFKIKNDDFASQSMAYRAMEEIFRDMPEDLDLQQLDNVSIPDEFKLWIKYKLALLFINIKITIKY